MTDTTRTTAKLATWGIVLTIGGLVTAIVAAHQSIFSTTLEALDRVPVQWDELGNGTPAYNWASPVAVLAGVLVVAGVWCLVAVAWRIADHVDRSRGPRRPGVPLPEVPAFHEARDEVEP